MQVSFDERGPYLVLPFERADEIRATLISVGVQFEDAEPDGAGCAGPVWVMLRLDEASLDAFGGPSTLERRF